MSPSSKQRNHQQPEAGSRLPGMLIAAWLGSAALACSAAGGEQPFGESAGGTCDHCGTSGASSGTGGSATAGSGGASGQSSGVGGIGGAQEPALRPDDSSCASAGNVPFCCAQIHVAGKATYAQTLKTAACGGNCTGACSDSLCAAQGAPPSPACSACLEEGLDSEGDILDTLLWGCGKDPSCGALLVCINDYQD